MNHVANAWGADGFGSYEIDERGRPLRRTDARPDKLVIPGFVDLHIHGGFGIDFMSAGRSDILTWCARLEEQGYEGFLPTTITAAATEVLRALATLPDHPMILGFHLEGPFLSPTYPGAQPPSFIVDPPVGPSEWDPILDDPRLKVVTLAPEQPGGLDLTRRLAKRGVIVSMGHTNATFALAAEAEAAGARHTTHTYNAMRPLHHREAGTVGYALASDTLACELIYDRHHVCQEAAALLVRSKPAGKLIAVSDGTMAAGMPAGEELRMWGLDAVVGESDVRLKDGTLAGSKITLLDAFRNLHDDFGPGLAIQACCIAPREALALGEPVRYLQLDHNLQIERLIG
jgi:N-acetylglucosamine-6-phosphate deacetylase